MTKKIITITIIVLLPLILLTGCMQNSSQQNDTAQNIYYVKANAESDYTSIQQAINAASDGDIIIVYEGIYAETIVINKTLAIKGIDAQTTHIIGTDKTKNILVTLNADNCTFSGFSIIGTNPSTGNIGIEITSSHNNISHTIIANNEKGINLKRDANNNHIHQNIFTNNQHGIHTYFSHYNIIKDNRFSQNESFPYIISYGIHLQNSIQITLTNNTISHFYRGINLKGAEYSDVYYNTLQHNTIGIYCCCGALDNIIYLNNFKQNQLHARDDFLSNWDNGTIGNYWDDYLDLHPDAQPINGVWNQPYYIYRWDDQEASYPKEDRYPLVHPIP
ncbi:MAG: NosD domain-containing protein [Thermoplasmatota archaeon]